MHVQSIAKSQPVVGPQLDPQRPKLEHAAHEFEAQMMKELMKPMTRTDNLGDSGDEDEDAGSGSALGEFAAEAMAQAISERGGFGVADRILRELSPHPETAPVLDQETPKRNAGVKCGKGLMG